MNVSATIRPAEPRGGLQSYVTGALLALALTLAPFALVMSGASGTNAVAGIFGLAVIQIVVHMVFFLHMTSKAEGGWTWMSLIFMVVLVVITLSGSLWVMYHLKTNMMPPSLEQMRNLP